MTDDAIVQVVTTVAGTVALWYRQRGYVTVDEYRTSKAALHNEVNELRVRLAVAETKLGERK